jgi:methionine sulfoxide reductase catalytic subunit
MRMNNEPIVLTALPVHAGAPGDIAGHRLSVRGLVSRELCLDREAFRRMPQADLSDDFACKEGWVVPGQRWHGVLVAEILDAAGVHAGARWVEFAAGDFRFSVALEEARAGVVALMLNGEQLPVEHGGPARLVLPGADCYTSVKWLDRIEVLEQPGLNVARDIALNRLAQ